MSAVPDDIAADFIVEAQEILDRLGEQLVSLEQAPDEADQLNAVFRGFHTLKGGAGFLAIKPMVELCHAAEETLGMARSGQAVLQAHHFDAAQQSLDYLQAMLDAMSSGEAVPHAPATLIAQFDAKSGPPAVRPRRRQRRPNRRLPHMATMRMPPPPRRPARPQPRPAPKPNRPCAWIPSAWTPSST